MRMPLLPAGLLVLALTGCAGGASPAASVEPSPEPSVAPPTASPEGPVILGVAVHWDGTGCIYKGPVVIRDGTTARVEYTFDEGTDPPLLFIGGVVPGTTWDTIVEYVTANPASEVPAWVILHRYANVDAGTSALYNIESDIAGEPVGGYFVGCATAPGSAGGTDKMYPAALLLIAGP